MVWSTDQDDALGSGLGALVGKTPQFQRDYILAHTVSVGP